MELTKGVKDNEIEEILITASGGPFLKLPIHKLKKVKPSEAIKHPNWKMGKKITIDSSTLMNKMFEIIIRPEAFSYSKNNRKAILLNIINFFKIIYFSFSNFHLSSYIKWCNIIWDQFIGFINYP